MSRGYIFSNLDEWLRNTYESFHHNDDYVKQIKETK